MANKRDSSQQRRAKQNRAQRAARQARREAASKPPEARRTTSSAAGAKASGANADAASSGERKGFFSAMREPRALRPGDVPVDIDALQGNWLSKRVQVPGGRQVLTAVVLTLVLSVMLAFTKFPPEGAPADADPTLSIVERFGSAAYLLVGLPLLIVAIAATFILHPQRRRIWIGCTVLLAAAVVAILSLYIIYLIVVGYLIYAIQRSAKIEGPAAGSRAARRAGGGDEAAPDVQQGPIS